MKRAFVVIISILILHNLFSQEKEAKGYVFNKTTNETVSDAMVTIGSDGDSVYTDQNGIFKIAVPKKKHYLLVSKSGFKTARISLSPGFQQRSLLVGLQMAPDSSFLKYRNVLTIAPLELIGGALALRYERFLKPKQSVGAHASIYLFGRNPVTFGSEYDYYVTYQGFKLSPFYRFYPIRNKTSGIFAEVKVPFGYIHFSELDYHFNSNNHPRVKLDYSFWTYGIGVSVGAMFKIPRSKHGVINISAGYQYFPIDVPATVQYPLNDGTWLNLPTDTYWWYRGGPGTSLDLKFTIGGIF